MNSSAALPASLPLNRRLLHTLLFYLAWVACLKSVALQNYWLGCSVVGSVVAFHLWQSSHRWADLLSLVMALTIGPLSDMLYLQLGLLEYTQVHSNGAYFPPIWVFSLWALFGANLHLFAWMHGKWKWALLFGGMGGPISYLSAIRLGGGHLLQPFPWSLLVISACWMLLLPFFLRCNQAIGSRWRSI